MSGCSLAELSRRKQKVKNKLKPQYNTQHPQMKRKKKAHASPEGLSIPVVV